MALPWSAYLTAVACDGRLDDGAIELAKFAVTSVELDDTLEIGPGLRDQMALEALVSTSWDAVSGPCPASGHIGEHRARLPEVVQALCDIVWSVRRRCMSSAYDEIFLRLLREMLDGFLREALWQLGEQPLPTLDQYLANGLHSVQSPVGWWIFAAYSAERVSLHTDVDRLRSAALNSGWCVRVANDVNGVERDRQSGSPNAVVLAADEWDCSERMAEQRLVDMMRRRLAELEKSPPEGPPSLTATYQAITRGTAFLVDWYLSRNDIEFSSEDHAVLTAAGISPAVVSTPPINPNY
ncbi:terpene synthase family protein [Micromonospora echinofusca]|uniref:Immunity protein 49 n=1 Tax=Micromonospora echinofusca TaxID=47858 RepID=A0ABS3VTP0_MICEH|nr:terpene synthase family protein [Micromonospora echinofusca]MBO4207899.1 hypothetical protein [Micromonospora echinofusca]